MEGGSVGYPGAASSAAFGALGSTLTAGTAGRRGSLPTLGELAAKENEDVNRASSSGVAAVMRQFDAADANRDGVVDRQEFAQWRRQQ